MIAGFGERFAPTPHKLVQYRRRLFVDVRDRGDDVLGFGLTALPDRGAVAGSGPDRIRIRQMGIPQ